MAKKLWRIIRWVVVIVLLLVIGIGGLIAVGDMPLHDYDAAIQKRNSEQAEKRVAIGNYREQLVTLPKSNIPIGLDVRFNLTQNSSDYQTVYLDLGSEKYISVMDCEGEDSNSGHYGNANYLLKAAGRTEVHFRCLPRFVWLQDEAWLHNEKRDHVCFRPHLLTEMLASDLKEYKDYRSPTATIEVGLNFGGFFATPTQNTPVITDLVTRIMPPKANLQNEKFWSGIINQSLQPATLAKEGYSKCFSTDNEKGWLLDCYCRSKTR